RGENREFQRWLANPQNRPPGAPTSQPKEQPPIKKFEDTPRPQGGGGVDPGKAARAAVWKSWSPGEKAAYVRARRADRWRAFVKSKTPEKGSFEEAGVTLAEATGIASIARAISGTNRLEQKLSWDERIGEGILGPAKLAATAGTIALGLPEAGSAADVAAANALTEEALLAGAAESEGLAEIGGSDAFAAVSEDVDGTTTGVTPELEAGAQRAIPLDPEVEELTESMLTRSE